MINNCLWISLVLLNPCILIAQKAEKDFSGQAPRSAKPQTTVAMSKSDTNLHSANRAGFVPVPRKAALLAAVLPGSGQLYNRDYWKVPLVYAALAGGTWTALYWRTRYNDFVKGYLSFYDLSDPASANYGKLKSGLTEDTFMPVFYRGGILNGERDDAKMYNLSQVKRTKADYRRYLERAVVVTAALYVLSIIEANVAAHMKTFDISDDLSLKIVPEFRKAFFSQPLAGVCLVFNFR